MLRGLGNLLKNHKPEGCSFDHMRDREDEKEAPAANKLIQSELADE